jgi:hypothetical protein
MSNNIDDWIICKSSEIDPDYLSKVMQLPIMKSLLTCSCIVWPELMYEVQEVGITGHAERNVPHDQKHQELVIENLLLCWENCRGINVIANFLL